MRSRILPLARATSRRRSQCIFCSFRSLSTVPRNFRGDFAVQAPKRQAPVKGAAAVPRSYSTGLENRSQSHAEEQSPTSDSTGASHEPTVADNDGVSDTSRAAVAEQMTADILSSIETSSAAAENEEVFVPPPYCPGCGAPSQTTDPEESGYYSTKMKREWIPRKAFRGLTGKARTGSDAANVTSHGDGTTSMSETTLEENFEETVASEHTTITEGVTVAEERTIIGEASVVNEITEGAAVDKVTVVERYDGEEEDTILFKAKVPGTTSANESGMYSTTSGGLGTSEDGAMGEQIRAQEAYDLEEGEECSEEEEIEGEIEGEEVVASEQAEKVREDPREVELRKRFFAEQEKIKPPLCGRCHALMHHGKGTPLPYPTFASVAQPMLESQFQNLYIYHIVDAADFPLSILPGLRRNILRHLPSSRSVRRNVTFSLIVTRADLLMPKENMVSSLMTYLRTVLKEALPEWMKTGDIRVVSAKNTWTTERVKSEIKGRRGSVFLIGRTNVGKSRLFESIYPRNNKIAKPGWGKGDGVERGGFNYDQLLGENAGVVGTKSNSTGQGESVISEVGRSRGYQFVEMPTVNEMPGTTAGAIRVPFSNGKGELVDLPGLARGNLLDYVRDEYIKGTVMTNRIIPEQYVIKPGQTLVLGGIIRISAVTEKVTLLAYPFLTLPAHVTNPSKAHDLLNHPDPASSNKPVLWSKPLIGHAIKSAGTFTLGWDVTQRRDPRLKHYKAAEMEKIPYRIYSTDLLVEGCGWIELVAEVLKWKDPPVVEVWSPLGKSIGSRPPMGAQALGKKKKKARPGSRPKMSMKGRAKEARRLAREANVPEFWKKIGNMAREARQREGSKISEAS